MRELVLYLRGYCELQITGASPQWALNRLTECNIAFWRVVWIDAVTVRLRVLTRDLKRAQMQAASAMCDTALLRATGILLWAKAVKRRPVLLIMIAVQAMLLFCLSQFVLFYEITGNTKIPDEMITRGLESLGIGFGAYGPDIDSQTVKDHMLNILPELQWITVNQNGCRAEVVVRERPETPVPVDRKGFGHVIASQSGVIVRQDVYAGQALYAVGDAVLKGELLVSGIVDLERVCILRNAQAEIYAWTTRNKTTVIPAAFGQKYYTGEQWKCVWLTVGKRRIKIFGNSRISTAECDKMIETKKLTLGDGLELPVSVTVETYRSFTVQQGLLSQMSAQLLLDTYTRSSVLSEMVAGEILYADQMMTLHENCYILETKMTCQEMIALPIQADWTKEEQDYDGTNSQRGARGTDH